MSPEEGAPLLVPDGWGLQERLLDSIAQAVIGTTPEGVIVYWNGAAERLYGWERSEVLGRNVVELTVPEDLTGEAARIMEVLVAGETWSGDFRVRRRDGSSFTARVMDSPMLDEAGQLVGIIGIAFDVTQTRIDEANLQQSMQREREQAAQLAHLALHDPLTGLANRALLNDRLAQALVVRRGHQVSVLLLDLDDFKSVNDVSGHTAGDQLLVEVARQLLRCVRAGDTVCRLGGDEFAIVIEDGDPDELARRLLDELSRPVVVENRFVVPAASIGIASGGGESTPKTLLVEADVAMYAAKAAGKGRAAHFTPSMAEVVRNRADLHNELRQAVVRDEIVVHYQPVMHVRSGSVSRMEALVRWQRAGALMPPSEFLPAAEETGLIIDIGREALRQTCEQMGGWLAEDERRSVAVNVSARQLLEETFVEQVLSSCGVRPSQLVLEVTESLFFAPGGGPCDQLAALRALGVRVSIDDFGTGYSSLGRLQTLPVDSVKIDKSFIELIRTGHEDLPILASMLFMSHSLGLDVTAEGVETHHQAQRLIALGFDFLQGYHFARPQLAQAALTDAANQATATLEAAIRS